jgi:phage-related baseplate assembly protein
MLLRNRFNSAIKKMLPHYSSGADLDNFVFAYYGGELRLQGEEPTANYEFELEEALSVNVTIPRGLMLSDGELNAYVNDNVTITAGTTKAIGKVKLDLKTKSSSAKTEIVISPFPYVIKAKSLEDFGGGSDVESDKDFFERAILSLYKYSTAGGKNAYVYFAKSADERVFDVKIKSPSPMVVDVVILPNTTTPEATNEVLQKVTTALTGDEKTQAFCDVVNVMEATKKDVILEATCYIFDLGQQGSILTNILSNLNKKFKIGESLPYSAIVSKLHIGGVYKVELEVNDILATEYEYISISAVNITFVEATL